ncbi:MAG: DUF3237 family protein [Actinomycetota bacterium]
MELEHVFDADLAYREDMDPVVSPDGREGTLLGSGEGTVRGPGLTGTIRFSFYEEGCPLDPGFLASPTEAALAEGDYLCKTNPGGVIETDDGATIQFDAKGFALRLRSNAPIWQVTSGLRFATDDQRYRWLNGILATYVGQFDEGTGRATWRVYTPADALTGRARRVTAVERPRASDERRESG